MNQKEINDFIDMFHRVHKECVIVMAKDFLARHRYDCRIQPRGCAIVWEEDDITPLMICYFDKKIHPSEFGIVAESKHTTSF